MWLQHRCLLTSAQGRAPRSRQRLLSSGKMASASETQPFRNIFVFSKGEEIGGEYLLLAQKRSG